MDKYKLKTCLINKQRKVLITFVVVLSVFIIFWNGKMLAHSPMRYFTNLYELPIAEYYRNYRPSKIKTILYWNTFFGKEDMYYGTGGNIFKSCPVSNCYATYNKSYLPVEQFDAIIFHAPRYTLYDNGFPEKRSIHQKYIFYSLESPYNTYIDENTKVDFYNWTMTYRNDSDLYSPYGLTVRSTINYVFPSVEEVRNKTKKVAWFVSNCFTAGSKRRLNYAKELSKYIPVDIYGKCGTFTCQNRTACYKMLEKDYKFYLSFENSMCKDYVTEKLFNILKYNVVPIVLGLFDNNDIAPPNSVINTKDFKNPEDLATYLWQLDTDVNKYLNYFKWKKSYKVINSSNYTLCQLCDKLNKPLKFSWYDNVQYWFFGFDCVL